MNREEISLPFVISQYVFVAENCKILHVFYFATDAKIWQNYQTNQFYSRKSMIHYKFIIYKQVSM